MSNYDIEFHWDPVCPFAWITSRWIEKVVAQKDYSVDWRFISLRIVNRDVDYERDFPKDYERGHTAGLRMLRVAAAVRGEVGRNAMGPLYTAFGESIWDIEPMEDRSILRSWMGTTDHIAEVLEAAGLDPGFVKAADDESFDTEITVDTEHALTRTGRDVGTPIVTFQPPDGPSFFGPVISQVPNDADAVRLWDNIIELATFPSFSELKRSLREVPQLRVLGASVNEPGEEIATEDWQGGSRRV